jgi:hypothetical protein
MILGLIIYKEHFSTLTSENTPTENHQGHHFNGIFQIALKVGSGEIG